MSKECLVVVHLCATIPEYHLSECFCCCSKLMLGLDGQDCVDVVEGKEGNSLPVARYYRICVQNSSPHVFKTQ